MTGKEAFPQQAFWMELKGLVLDGVKFAQARAAGGGAVKPRSTGAGLERPLAMAGESSDELVGAY